MTKAIKDTGTKSHRLRVIHVVLALTMLANLALAGRIVAVDPIARFYPLCRVHKFADYVRLREPLSRDFTLAMHIRLQRSRWDVEPGTLNYRLYIPLWDYLREHDDHIFYSLTAEVLDTLYERNELGRRMTREEFFSTETMDCPFVRRWALKQNGS